MGAPSFDQIIVIGAGMMGSSLIKALSEVYPITKIKAVVKKESDIAILKQKDITATTDLLSLRGNNRLFVMAMPLNYYEEVFSSLAKIMNNTDLVIDIGSVKEPTLLSARELLNYVGNFVPCHPIAGSDLSGIGQIVEGLYKGANVIITCNDSSNRKRICDFWASIDATTSFLHPKEHDKIYANISHLVQRIAFVYAEILQSEGTDLEDLKQYIAMDEYDCFVRLCNSNTEIWNDIFKANDIYLSSAERSCQKELNKIIFLLDDYRLDDISKMTDNAIAIVKPAELIPIPANTNLIIANLIVIAYVNSITVDSIKYAGSGFKDFIRILHHFSAEEMFHMKHYKSEITSFLGLLLNKLE